MIDQERDSEIRARLLAISVTLALIIIAISFCFWELDTALITTTLSIAFIVIGYIAEVTTGLFVYSYKWLFGSKKMKSTWGNDTINRIIPTPPKEEQEAPKHVSIEESDFAKTVLERMAALESSLQQLIAQQTEQNTTSNNSLAFLRKETQSLRSYVEGYDKKMNGTVAEIMGGYERRFKNGLLDEILGASSNVKGYAQSDAYEKQQFEKQQQEKIEELRYREMRTEVKEEMVDQKSTILNLQTELRQGFAQIDSRFVKMDADFSEKLSMVSQTVTTFKEYLVEKITRLELKMTNELSGVRDTIGRLRVELKQDVTDLRVHTNNEIVRIDKQQGMIIAKLEEYEAKTKGFVNEVARIKNEAQHFALQGREVLNRAETLYRNHKTDMKLLSGEVQDGLNLISIHKAEFANEAGRTKIMLDKISQDQYLTLKEIGYERLGVDMVRQDFHERQQNEKLKLQQIQQDISHTKQMIDERIKHGKEVASLQHNLAISQENEAYTRQRLGLLRQENAMVRRLAR